VEPASLSTGMWRVNIWIFGTKHARNISTKHAVITIGVPVGIGLSWERSTGEFSVIEVPAVIVSIETFVSLQKDAETILGFNGASVLLYETGKKAGVRWINRFSKEWGLKDKKFIKQVVPILVPSWKLNNII
jgi:hypothetical protein